MHVISMNRIKSSPSFDVSFNKISQIVLETLGDSSSEETRHRGVSVFLFCPFEVREIKDCRLTHKYFVEFMR